jgi:hypothetical protein
MNQPNRVKGANDYLSNAAPRQHITSEDQKTERQRVSHARRNDHTRIDASALW